MNARIFRVMVPLLLVSALSLVMEDAHPTDASHPYSKPALWADLQVGGDGRIQYNLCGDGTPAEANWTIGVENWDSALGPAMEFDSATCFAGGLKTKLQWESFDECLGYIACWITIGAVDFGSYWRLTTANIWFDKGQYVTYSTSWQQFISGHEWGHNLSLDHHTSTGPYTENSVMAYVTGNSCLTGPLGNDVSRVWCSVYRACAWHGFTSWGSAADQVPAAMASDFARLDHTHMVQVSGCELYEKWWTGSVWTRG